MWWKWVGGINQIFHAKCGSNRWRDCSLLPIAVYRDDQSICSFFKAEKVIYPAGSSTYRKMNKSWNLLYTHTMAIHRNSDAFWWHFIFQIFFCLFLLFLSFFFNAIPLFCRMASRLLLQCQSSIYRQFNDPRRIHTFLFAPTFLHTRIFIINRLVMMNGSNSFSWNHF